MTHAEVTGYAVSMAVGIAIGLSLERVRRTNHRPTSDLEPHPAVERLPDDIEKAEIARLYLQEWTTVIQTQMHFNDLIIRFRTTVLTVLVAFLGALAAAARSESFGLTAQDSVPLLLLPGAFWLV